MTLVFRSIKGSKLTSAEVDGNFSYLESLIGGQGNAVVSESGFTLVDQDLTINADWVWAILGVSYTNAAAVVLNIPFASSGNQRIDLIVANQSNTFERVAGTESASNPTAPPVPTNKILVTFMTVTDGVVGTPVLPIVGSQFKKKSESAAFNNPSLSGTNAIIQLQPNGQSGYAFSNAGLTSIDGLGLDLITGNPDAETPYEGKDIIIYNNKSTDLILLHDGPGTASSKFLLEDSVDLVIPAGGKVWLKYGVDYTEMIFKSWSVGAVERISVTHSPMTLISMSTLGTWAFFDYRGFSGATLSYSLGTGTNPSITADLSSAISIIPPIGKKLKGFYFWNYSGLQLEFGFLKSDVITPSTNTTADTNTNRRFIQKFSFGNNYRQPVYHEITMDDTDAVSGSQYFPCVINSSGSTQSLRFCAIYIIE